MEDCFAKQSSGPGEKASQKLRTKNRSNVHSHELG